MDMEMLAIKIQRIEDNDPNYLQNKRWNELRNLQDKIYSKMAIAQVEEINNKLLNETDENKIAKLIAKRTEMQKVIIKEDENERYL